ncbi:PHP domain-containing protein [Dubosiella newyorkensis]|jgi:histidinol-phosphatase (PHP family)|uniref:PHP domain-containing protein n=1 Tax=Dubosiella newyorkensis TaxID=1862672 RepID=UPI002352070E|nr:PHP domain-containing protein [Dubosiella newyorkensis]MCI9042094.1 histidinol phosphate phosphatase [Dubosiella newyorkensis]
MKNKADGHVHLENGPLSKEYVWEFVKAAQEQGIEHLQILDHTHRFYEFHDMYKGVYEADPRQKEWFEKKQVNSIKDYHKLIEEMKNESFPIDVQFGLEVCYSPENESFLKEILSQYPYDFLVGSVHSIDGLLYDMDAFSKDLLWEKEDVSSIYKRYYDRIAKAIQSDLFTQIGHPDVIKMYNYPAGYDLTETYKQLARLAKEHRVKMEDNTGAHYRYHHHDVGLDPAFRQILLDEGVEIITASDAHYPKHVAKDFDLLLL